MVKPSYPNIISLLLPVMILIPCIICALFNAPEVLRPLTTNFLALSPESPVFSAEMPAQKAIPASQASITIGGFKFRIVEVVFDETAMGFTPVNMAAGNWVLFVEFELQTGNKDDFKSLEVTVSNGYGQKSKAFILISGGMMQMLATVTLKGVSSNYKPLEDNVTWAFVVPKGVDKLYLNFPTGDRVDLTPFLKLARSAASKPGLLLSFFGGKLQQNANEERGE